MTDANDTADQPSELDEQAAHIDARSEDAPAQIEELVAEARAEGLPASMPGEDALAPGNFVDDRSDAEIPEPNEPA